MAYVVIATWTAREGEGARVAKVLARMIEPSRSEPGCISYQPLRDRDDRDRFVIYEVYADETAYEAHQSAEHFQRHAIGEGFPLLASRERVFLDLL